MAEPINPQKVETAQKPAYEKPEIVDLSQLQRGQGGLPVCESGSGNQNFCMDGAGFINT